jgi:hypothetical protein
MLRLAGCSLFAAALFVAACGGDDGPPGSVQSGCNKYAMEKAKHWADSPDGLIPGVITVGFIKGTTGPKAAAFLKTLETSYWLPMPFHEFGVVCTDEGHEQAWADLLKQHDIVEWSHREGTRPLAAP